jgi:hypothetical protein
LNAKLLSDEADTLIRIRADLSAEWTLLYQGADIVVFLIVGLVPFLDLFSTNAVIGALTVLGALTSLLGETFDSLGDFGGGSLTWTELQSAVLAVPVQFSSDIRPVLLAPFVFGFGFSTAMFYAFVNGQIISDTLGESYVGLFECLSFIVAVIAAYPYAYISKYFTNGRHWVMQFGSFSFLVTGIGVLALRMDDLEKWYVIFCIKFAYGLGRGVFEGSCRAIYAEVFGRGSADDLSTAFSGQTLLAGFSGGTLYFLSVFLSKEGVGGITLVNGFLLSFYMLILLLLERICTRVFLGVE